MAYTLSPETVLHLEGDDRRSRLSYVFKDSNGFRVGVTSAWILPSLSAASTRPAVFSGGERLGLVNPSVDDYAEEEANIEPSDAPVLSAGWLTCCFQIDDGPTVDKRFMHAEARPPALSPGQANVAVRIPGEGMIGTMGDSLDHINWHDRVYYPLRRLNRSAGDMAITGETLRSGAMVTTDGGALVGAIISVSRDRACYAVAPILDILATHDLGFLAPEVRVGQLRRLRAKWRTPRVTPRGGREVLHLLEDRFD